MPFIIEYNKNKDYYSVIHTGADSQAEYLQSKTDLMQMMEAKSKVKLFVNLYDAQRTSMSKQEQFELSNKLTDGTFLNMQIAFVMPKALEDQNDWYFIVEICKNSGINVKPFYTEDKALAWLLD